MQLLSDSTYIYPYGNLYILYAYLVIIDYFRFNHITAMVC